jgi:branched-chain amino acid transport system substrate-binding protein
MVISRERKICRSNDARGETTRGDFKKKGDKIMRVGRKFNKLWVKIIAVSVILFTSGLAFAAEKQDVRIIGLYDLTGPYSALHTLIVKGINDCVKWINDTEYIPGVRMVHDVYDTGADVGKAIAAYQMGLTKAPKPVISTGGGATSTILAIKPLAERNRVPCIDGSSARSVIFPPGWAFSMQGLYEGIVPACAGWIKDNWKADSKVEKIRMRYQNRPPRVSILGFDNPFGRAFESAEMRAYLKKIGVDFVQPEYIPMPPTDTSAELLRLKKGGADFIYFGMLPSSHAVVLKDAKRLGIRDDFIDICHWATNIWELQKYVGSLADNTFLVSGYLPIVDEWPKYFRETFQKSGLGMEYALGYSVGLSWFDLYSEAIRRAGKAAGSTRKVDGESIYQALMTINNFRTMAYSSKISFSKTKVYGPDTADLYQMQKGKVVRIGKDLYLPELLPGGKDVPK